MIYFDNAATSFYKPKNVVEKINYSLKYLTANPGRSGHSLSQKVAEEVFDTREILKKFFNALDYDVIFTKNCTEALNFSIFGLLKPGDHVITTVYEHNSILRPIYHLQELGVEITILDCEIDELKSCIEKAIKSNTKLVVTTMCSNVTGDVVNVEEIGNMCKVNKVLYLVDGAQASGHMNIDLQKSNIDMFTFAGHKGLLSLTGVGGLIIKKGLKINPLLYGGTGTESESLIQPTESIEGFESGTLPSISIISLKAGVEYLTENFSFILEKERVLSEYLYKKLKNLKFITLYSKENALNVFSFNLKNCDSMTVADELNYRFNICVRSGLHCAPLIHKKLGTIKSGAVRVSLDFNNSIEEIDELIYALTKINFWYS